MASVLSFDRRRVNGPEKSAALIYEDEVQDSRRSDASLPRKGRKPSDGRRIFLKLGLVKHANGSAYIELEKTKIACAVYGPRQVKNAPYNEKGKLNVEVKFTPFSSDKRRAPMRDAEDRSVSVLVAQSLLPSLRLELYPKSSVDVYVTIIEHDGIDSCVAACTIAASAAIADAGVEMLGLVTSCCSAQMTREIWVDPAANEAVLCRGIVALAYMPALNTITNVWQTGELSLDEIEKCMQNCIDRCNLIHQISATALLDSARTRMKRL